MSDHEENYKIFNQAKTEIVERKIIEKIGEYKYEGEVQFGDKHGKGRIENSEYIYEGYFNRDSIHGHGIKKYKNRNEIIEGNWHRNEPRGEFTITKDNKKLHMNNGVKGKGYGIIYKDNNKIYEGGLIEYWQKQGRGWYKAGDIEYHTIFKANKIPKGSRALVKGKNFEYDGFITNKEFDGLGILKKKENGVITNIEKGIFKNGKLFEMLARVELDPLMELNPNTYIFQDNEEQIKAKISSESSRISQNNKNLELPRERNDLKDGRYSFQVNEYLFEANIKNKKLNGEGSVAFPDGKLYRGLWIDNKAHGIGTLDYPNNVKYEGVFSNNMKEGKGFLYGNSQQISGYWKKDKLTGECNIIFDNGDNYEGTMRQGLFNNQGIFTWKNKSCYIGTFKDGKRSGFGTYTDTNGQKYEGQWLDDEYNGYGKIEYPNGDTYDGEWYKGKYHGIGIYCKKNGEAYILENQMQNLLRVIKIDHIS